MSGEPRNTKVKFDINGFASNSDHFIHISMGITTSSDRHVSIWPFSRDARDDLTPFFLRTDATKIKTIEQASQAFVSLVDFIKEGSDLDDKATRQACSLLERIRGPFRSLFTDEQILFELVPTHDDSCSGFTESIVLLLTSSNAALVTMTWTFLDRIVNYTYHVTRFAFLETGFFCLLPQTFFEQEIHLSAQPHANLMTLVKDLLLCSFHDNPERLCEEKQLSMDAFQHIFMGQFVHPVKPFLDFICNNRHRIIDSACSWDFGNLMWKILETSPFLEPMTEFVLSSSIPLSFTDTLHSIETDLLTSFLLRSVVSGFRQWHEEYPAVQKRSLQIVAKLREEGISDEVELLARCSWYDDSEDCFVLLGAQLTHMLGGNAPFVLGE
ncbi:hypothetical protein BLNAU_6691 [Blattamonas nauphoetae]|uniref:Uncharacterized protein n=1 Tax=Blattamonas nauphoetae TaxID=2049346 RepID=A0ABQ9Y3U6_9EUKA|nr:hypothetical protein BLNAU_6691 [Blattamonas nauphoetae]